MDLRRKIYDQMLQWKQKKERKALVIEGLRQIGKSYIVNKFASENYDVVYSFDFRQYETHRQAFRNNFSLDDFKESLFLLFKREFNDANAVLVFDEIGDCPDARAAIKYILSETRFDIIATGSLLGVKGFINRESRSPSVGSNHYITMHPMDFEEFLWANNVSEAAIEKIKDAVKTYEPLDEMYHERFTTLFTHYILSGGMPEAVLTYLETHDFSKVIETNANKLKDLQGDFGRVVDSEGRVRVNEILLTRTNEVFSSIISQLAKNNAKFQYSYIKKGGRAKEYEEAIVWLENAGIVTKCVNLNDLALPLSGYAEDSTFKLYFSDIGLYVAKMGVEAASLILNGSLDSYGGYVYEGVAADVLNKAGLKLYYSDNGKSEIDFVIQDDNKVSILEVKMVKGNSKSAKAVIEGTANRHAAKCYKITAKNFSTGSYYFGLPHYALPFLIEGIVKQTSDSLTVSPGSFNL